MEPLLQAILGDNQLYGYQFQLHESITQPLVSATTSSSQAPFDRTLLLPIRLKLLCYADDTLAFLQSPSDLDRLALHLDTYCRATNAKINYNKVQALSLSGANIWDYWQPFLSARNILHLHSEIDVSPLVYLGYPLIQSIQQRHDFMTHFLTKIQTACTLHSRRSLSVLGKATVLNTLILSKCWYILRVLPLPKSDVSRITSIAQQFLNQFIFPRIAWSTWTLDKTVGGLSIIDPSTQQLALYNRWVRPLLSSLKASSMTTTIYELLRRHYCNVHNTIPLEVPLSIQTSRRSFGSQVSRPITSAIDVIDRVVDSLPRFPTNYFLNASTGLCLPLLAYFSITKPLYKIPKKAHQLFGTDIFYWDSSTSRLQWLPIDQVSPPLKRCRNSLLFAYRCSSLTFSAMVACLFDGSSSTDTSLGDPEFSRLRHIFQYDNPHNSVVQSTKYFRTYLSEESSLIPFHMAVVAPSNWLHFWTLSLTYVAR